MSFLVDGPDDAPATFAMAHGAGAPMDSPFMEQLATELSRSGIRVVRFEFPYMQRRRTEGIRPGPDRYPVLQSAWREVVEQLTPAASLFIGGKSMGGRIASMLADELGVRGLICLGYPFHPPGKPDRLRTAHLADLRTPTLILQGERDTLGSRTEIEGYELSPSIRTEFLPDGDHSFRPRVRSGHTLERNMAIVVEQIEAFVSELSGSSA